MARYKIQAPDGRTITIEGDAPPTEQELEQIFQETAPKPFGEQLKADVAQAGYGYANEALLNAPDLLTKIPQLSGLNPGKPTDTSEKIARGVGSVAGFATGLPAKIGKKAIMALGKPVVKAVGKQVGKRFALGALEAGAGSLASTPFRAMAEGKDFSPKEEAVRTGLAMGGGGLAGNIAARFSRGGKYIASRNDLRAAEDRLSKLTAELTQLGDRKLTTALGKEIKPSQTFESLNKQLKQTTDDIFRYRDSLIQQSNRKIDAQEYLMPLRDWINKMDSTPEFAGKLEPVKRYFDERLSYHLKNGMDLVGLQDMKESMQRLTKTMLESSAPTESQGIMKQAMNELRGISKGVLEKYVPQVAELNAKYEPLMEGMEATGKMAEEVRKSVQPTMFQSIRSKIPHIGKSPVETGMKARELERRLPQYTEEIAGQAESARKASQRMGQLRPKFGPQMPPMSSTGAVRPAPPRPGSGLLGGPEPMPQLTGPSSMPQLPAPENLYGETFRTLTPEEQAVSGLASRLRSMPQGPTPTFPKLVLPEEYTPVRPVIETAPVRGTFPLETGGIRIEGPTPTPYEKGVRTQLMNRLLQQRRMFPPKRLEE